jgi:hypothetical protein
MEKTEPCVHFYKASEDKITLKEKNYSLKEGHGPIEGSV